VLAQSQEKILLADGSKFQGSGLMAYGSLEDMTVLVTDDGSPREALRRWADSGVEVIVAG
jgi:DeoR/GlpR family transcriptional regulator of sugar metabolism